MTRIAIAAAMLCGLVCSCDRPQPKSSSVSTMSAKRGSSDEPAASRPSPPPPAQAAGAQAAEPAPSTQLMSGNGMAKDAPRRNAPGIQGGGKVSEKVTSLRTSNAQGVSGLGLRGTGSGGGGVGAGTARGVGAGETIGIGSISTKGRGSGGSVSYGSGAGAIGHASGYGSAGVEVRSGQAIVMGARRAAPAPTADPTSTNAFHDYGVNPFTTTEEDRLSTFAADVDTASYAIARRSILSGNLPSSASVRVEEFLNYFHYSYAPPSDDRPLEVHLDAAPSPFTPGRTLLRVGVQARQLKSSERKPLHLTFLVDVSGSMQSPDRLPLAKRALRILVDSLRDGDTVALCTYAGATKDVLPPTGMEQKAKIYSAIEDLHPGGSTAMASGLDLAYRNAMKALDGKSVSRVLVLTDGDANVGASSHEEMLKQIQKYVKEGVTLTTVGFGMGNLKDETLEQLANKGNGNYYYVDSLMQARRIFHEQMGSTLEVVAQDVKIQVELDPSQVKRYRLLGYENRAIADRDFRNDRVDAGEVGSGHTVTALYELELKPGTSSSHEGLATVRIRAKKPRGERADEWAFPLRASAFAPTFDAASQDFRFASAVMAAAEKFRRSPYAQPWDFDQIVRIARGASPADNPERKEFVSLLDKARPVVGAVAAK